MTVSARNSRSSMNKRKAKRIRLWTRPGTDYSNAFTRIRDAVAAIVFPRASHSITTSALLIIEGGMVMPRAAAAFRLRNNSTSVTSCTGRSEGFSPLRIRPA